MSNKTHQVWHDRAWPGRDLITEMTGEIPRFPDDYVHVANVRADSPEEAVKLTVDEGGTPDDPRPWSPWERNDGVEALVRRPRDTGPGDVVVDPQGRAYWATESGFEHVAMPPDRAAGTPRDGGWHEEPPVGKREDGPTVEGQRPMPTEAQMKRVVDAIQRLPEENSFKRVDDEHVALVPYGRAMENGYFFWDELVPAHRRDALARGIDWDGFNASERADVIMRVLDDEPSHRWMRGVKEYNQWEDFPWPLTEKQHAAYLADIAASYGMTEEEMDDYYERVATEDDAELEDGRALPRLVDRCGGRRGQGTRSLAAGDASACPGSGLRGFPRSVFQRSGFDRGMARSGSARTGTEGFLEFTGGRQFCRIPRKSRARKH